MKVVLLCAGYATRLYPLTENQPKPLLPLGGIPILQWILERVDQVQGVDTVYLVSNHKFASHFEQWASNRCGKYPLQVIDDGTTSNDDRLGAIGDLNFVLRSEKIDAEDLLVIAGDNFFDFNLREFVNAAEKKRPYGVIAVYDVQDQELAKKYGLVRTDEEGKILEFFEKPQDPPTTLASCGIYWLPREKREYLDRYLSEGHNADQPGHYMRWLAEHDLLFASPLNGCWFDIGDLDSYHKANGLAEELRRRS